MPLLFKLFLCDSFTGSSDRSWFSHCVIRVDQISLILWTFAQYYSALCLLFMSGFFYKIAFLPPLRRQGPDARSLWLLVGTPSAFGHEFAYRLRVAQPTLMDVTRYLLYTFILLYMFVYSILWPLHFGWLLVLSLHKEDYLQMFKCVSFWLHGFCG